MPLANSIRFFRRKWTAFDPQPWPLPQHYSPGFATALAEGQRQRAAADEGTRHIASAGAEALSYLPCLQEEQSCLQEQEEQLRKKQRAEEDPPERAKKPVLCLQLSVIRQANPPLA